MKSQAGATTLWLGPEVVDFKKSSRLEFKGRRMHPAGTEIKPNLSVLLEVAHTRAERPHPFWAKVESKSNKPSDFSDPYCDRDVVT